MLERLLLVIVISIAILLIYRISIRLSLRRRAQLGLNLEQFQMGHPAILYFTTPNCMPCKTVQRPALDKISSYYGDEIQIIEINALTQPELADSWGVLSVPTTFIIDAKGRPRRVNHGATKADKLISQLMEISAIESTSTNLGSESTAAIKEHGIGMD
ncbi:MAG: thioredoxin family protein [Anaerolineales bacterium]